MPEPRAKSWLAKVRKFLQLDKLPPVARKFVVASAGGLVLLAGLIMLVTPGPAFVLIPLGLLILGCEFQWAQEAAQKVMDGFHRLKQKWQARKKQKAHAATR